MGWHHDGCVVCLEGPIQKLHLVSNEDEHGTSNGRGSAAGWLVGDRAWRTSTLAPWVAMHGSCAGGTNRCLTLAYCYT